MGKKGAKRKTRWRTLSIGTPPGEEDEEDGSQRNNAYVKSDQRSSTHYANKESSQRNGYHHNHHNNHHHHHHNHQQQQQPWLKSRHGSAGSSNGGSSSSGYASGESRNVAFNEDEYTKITTPRQDMLFKKGYLTQKKQLLYASTSATPSTNDSQSASHSTAGRDGSEAAEDQQLLDNGTATDYLPGSGVLDTTAPPQLSYGTYYDHATGYYYEYPMMLVGPALAADQMHHLPCAALPCAPVPLRPIEWVNPAFVPKLASQQYCYMDYQTQGPDCAALVDSQGMPLSNSEPLTNGLSNHTSLTDSASVSASGSVVDEVDENGTVLAMVDHEMSELPQPTTQNLEVVPLEMVEQPGVMTMPMEYAPVEATPYVESQTMPYLYPGQYMFGPPVVNVNGVTIQSGPMLRCNDMVVSSATAALAAAKRRKKKKKKKQKRPHALGNTEDEDEEDYSSEGDAAVSSPSRVPWTASSTVVTESTTTESATTTTTAATTTTASTSWPLNPECQEFHLPEVANSSMESSEQQNQQLSDELKRLNENEPVVAEIIAATAVTDEESVKPKTRRRSLKIVREATPGPDLCDVTTDERHDDHDDDHHHHKNGEKEEEVVVVMVEERPIEQITTILANASIIETPRKDADVDTNGWQNESSITSGSCCAASRTADETDSGFESQQSNTTPATTTTSSVKSRPITDAVTEWLKRANSPDLFITSDDNEEDDDDERVRDDEEDEEDNCDDQSKNLQGNPMPALSVNGQASREQFDVDLNTPISCKHRMKKKRTLRRKRDQSEQCGKQDPSAQESQELSVQAADNPPGVVSNELYVNKDSDAGMRVASKTRTNILDDYSSTQPVKTYEKGEIVVSMDGELLLVETINTRRDSTRSCSSSSSSSSCSDQIMEVSLGSIEEPDLVLECWEPESVEPIVIVKTKIEIKEDDEDDDEAIGCTSSDEDKQQSIGHVQRYYRLMEDQVEPAVACVASDSQESSDEDDEEIVEVVVTPDKCISYDPKLPVDEAFEVYESCYNGKSLSYEHTGPPFYRVPDPNETPVHCRANCCVIQ